MRAALADLRFLWKTRRTSGFPWPLRRGWRGRDWHLTATGYPWYSPVPLRRQLARWPLRPWRYARRVREIARVRRMPYAPADYDEVA